MLGIGKTNLRRMQAYRNVDFRPASELTSDIYSIDLKTIQQ